MATILADGDIVEVHVITQTATQRAINTLHYRVSGSIGFVDTEDVAEEFDPLFAPLWKAVMAPQGVFVGVEALRIAPGIRSRPDGSFANPGPGVLGTNIAPSQVAGLITGYAALAGRKYRSRIYLPFPACEENVGTTNRPSTDYVTAAQALADQVYIAQTVTFGVDSANLNPVIWHRGSATYSDIVERVARGYWGTQRRRSSASGAD